MLIKLIVTFVCCDCGLFAPKGIKHRDEAKNEMIPRLSKRRVILKREKIICLQLNKIKLLFVTTCFSNHNFK